MHYSSKDGDMHGPALIEKADYTVEMGYYKENKQDGLWKQRLPNGQKKKK